MRTPMLVTALALAATVLLPFGPARAATTREFVPHSFRHEIAVLGMGGAYTAGAWRGSGIFYNPASLARKRFHLNIPVRVEIGGIGGVGGMWNALDYFRNNRKDLDDIEHLSRDHVRDLDLAARRLDGNGGVVRVFPAIRYGTRTISLQTYGVFDGSPRMDAGIFQPRLDLAGFGDAGVIVGRGQSFRTFDHRWYAGIAMKGFLRWEINRTYPFQEAAEGPQFFRDVVSVVGENRRHGAGIDAGIQIPVGRTFAVGVAAQDLYTFGEVKPAMSLNAGMYYRVLPRVHLVADYRDILDESGTPLPMHVHFGGEVDLTLLRFRAGAFQGYPTFGLGINLWLMKIDGVYYSRERGDRLGRETEDMLAFEIQFGLE